MLTIQKIKDFFEVAESRLYEKIKDTRRNLIYGIKNLWIWFPVIWKDRQWDHQYIYGVLRHKLYLTEQLIRHHGYHVYHTKDADKIKVCVDLLDRLIKDEYHEMAFKSHEKKWGRMKLNFKDSINSPGVKLAVITHPNVKTDKDKINERKDFKIASQRETELREQDLDLLFKMMRKHIQSWWD